MILPEFREDVCLVKHLLPAITILNDMLANTVGNKLRDLNILPLYFHQVNR
jgi:hypothetical protein